MINIDSGLKNFSGNYFQARDKFLQVASEVRSYKSTGKGPKGEALWTDTAWFGDRNAKRVGIMVAATHGVEGYCGSAAQLDWIENGGPGLLGRDEAVLLIHGLNPYGFAHDRRVTHEGCDLNRNFLDFTQLLTENDAYDELATYLVPPTISRNSVAEADAYIKLYKDREGDLAFERALKSGQYRHPTGLYYGGRKPTTSHETLKQIEFENKIGRRDLVLIIDYHTGLGPYGYGEIQTEEVSRLAGYERARAIYGQSVTSPIVGTSSSISLNGTQAEFWERLLGERHTYVCLEFGTYDAEAGRIAMRDDHWLHLCPANSSDQMMADKIKAAMRRFFYPQNVDWKEAVLWRSRQVQRQFINGLKLQ